MHNSSQKLSEKLICSAVYFDTNIYATGYLPSHWIDQCILTRGVLQIHDDLEGMNAMAPRASLGLLDSELVSRSGEVQLR